MSERIDRRIGSSRTLLWTLAVIFASAAGAGLYVWLRMTAPSALPVPAQDRAALPQPAQREEPLPMITLYAPVDGMLAAGSAAVLRQSDTQSQAREALIAVLADPRSVQSPVLRDLRLRALYYDADTATAYVDLTSAQQSGIRASAWEEFLGIYAVVNTLTQDFEEIKQVRILVDGRETQTLAGHLDLARKFTKRMDLVKQ